MTARDGSATTERLRACLRAIEPSAPWSLDGDAHRLTGGRSAELIEFRLETGPDDLVGRDLVLRIPPGQVGTPRESIVQGQAAAAGFPTPPVLRAGLLDDGRSYLLMPRAPGRSMFDALGPRRTLRQAPTDLARLMVALHDVDPSPIRTATSEADRPDLDVVPRALSEIDATLERADDHGHRQLRRWLDENGPPTADEVVCHGDLHALNVLVDRERETVLDWEVAGLGPPAFDVARTKLLMHAVPTPLPRGLRPIVQRLGLAAASRFESAYVEHRPLEPAMLRWFDVLHRTRMRSIVLAHPERPDPVAQTWAPTLPLLTSSLTRLTGVPLAAP